MFQAFTLVTRGAKLVTFVPFPFAKGVHKTSELDNFFLSLYCEHLRTRPYTWAVQREPLYFAGTVIMRGRRRISLVEIVVLRGPIAACN